MAFGRPTSNANPVTGLWGAVAPKDVVANKFETKTPWQQFGQAMLQPHVLNNLYRGYKADSTQPAMNEAARQYREQILPHLQGQFAQHGDQSALLRGIQGAGSDLQSRMAMLQYEKQHEMNKLRQENLPKFAQLGQEQNFETHLTGDRPVNYTYMDDPNRARTMEDQLANTKIGQAGQNAVKATSNVVGEGAQRIGTAAGKKIGEFADYATRPPRTQEELRAEQQQQQQQKAQAQAEAKRVAALTPAQRNDEIKAAKAAAAEKVKAGDLPLPVADKIREYLRNFMEYSKDTSGKPVEPAVRPGETPEAAKEREQHEFNVKHEIERFAREYHVPENVVPFLTEDSLPAVRYLSGRVRGREELEKITSADQIEKIARYWTQHPAKRTKFLNYVSSMFKKLPVIGKPLANKVGLGEYNEGQKDILPGEKRPLPAKSTKKPSRSR